MKNTFDYLILGSGISGMTLALLFASSGAKTAVLERSNAYGGAMQRFRRNGVPLDTGFHFTGNLTDSFGDMLYILGIRDMVKTSGIRQKIFFRNSGNSMELPAGIRALEEFLLQKYPLQIEGIKAYFAAEQRVFDNTPLFHLQTEQAFEDELPEIPEDRITLDEFLDHYNIHGELRGILCAVCSCHGTPPQEISFANHARIHYGLSNDPLRIVNGGEAIVNAFIKRAGDLNITLMKNNEIKSWGEMDDSGKIYSAVLADGSVVEFKNLIFTQHPKEILRMLPPEKLRAQFCERINSLADSCGFYTWYAVLDDNAMEEEDELCSCLSSPDLNSILDGCHPEERTTGFVFSTEQKSDGTFCRCVTAFQSVFADETAAFADSTVNNRPAGYTIYKQNKDRELEELFYELYPQYRNRVKHICSSSMLTFRDYLGSSGSAYGVRQKIFQNNLFGRLPVRNFYTASQSSILPGAVGSMLTALVLFRKLAGEDAYKNALSKVQKGGAL